MWLLDRFLLAGRSLAVLAPLALLALPARAQFFLGLGELPGGVFYSGASGVSADGSVVVGQSGSASSFEAFRWTQGTGMLGLGDLPGGVFYSGASGVSADGSVVVGTSRSASSFEAFRWTQRTGMLGLGDLPGGIFQSGASGVSADGSVVVGTSRSGLGSEAYRWTAETGMVGLGDLPGGAFTSFAYGVSADGSVVVGQSRSALSTGPGPGPSYEAYRWTQGAGMVGLGDLPGGAFNSSARAVSADGSVVVGFGSSASGSEAFRWTQGTGMVGLGVVPGLRDTIGNAVSADGSVVVGTASSGPGSSEASIWDAPQGMRRLTDVLIGDYGLDLTGWRLTTANGISADGTVIVGSGVNPSGQNEAWLARVPGIQAIPEPGTFTLFAAGLLPLAGALRRRRCRRLASKR